MYRDNDLFKGEKNRGFKKLFLANIMTIKPAVAWRENEVKVDYRIYPGEFGENHLKASVPPIFEYNVERNCCETYCLK